MKIGVYDIEPSHYNDIPVDILKGDKTILEFGCATGINNIISIHRDFFIENNKQGRYLGVDLEPYEERYLNIKQGDIRTFHTDQQYDIVIALHVLEHIEIEYWEDVIKRLVSMVKDGGFLLIGTPYNEEPNEREFHFVYRITPEMFLKYLPDADIRKRYSKYLFAEDGARFSWALLRYIKRWITRHPYIKRTKRLLVIWQKVEK